VTEENLLSSRTSIDSVPRRNWRRFIIRISTSVLVLVLLFLFLPRKQLFEALGGFPSEIWLAGIPTYLCVHLIGVAKWRMLVNSAGTGLSFTQAARCYYYGLFGNTFLPSLVGGDILRAGLAIKMGHCRRWPVDSVIDAACASLSVPGSTQFCQAETGCTITAETSR